jgi:hypothetical protein
MTLATKRSKENAMLFVEENFGTLDEFFDTLLSEYPDIIENGITDATKQKVSQDWQVSISSLSRLVNMPEYENYLDRQIAKIQYNQHLRAETIEGLVKIATNPNKTVQTKAGGIAEVDRDAKEIIAADEYLRALQGRPVTDGDKSSGSQTSITISFGSAREINDGKTIVAEAYKPNLPGQLPPSGTRKYYEGAGKPGENGQAIPMDYDFSSEEDSNVPKGARNLVTSIAIGKGSKQ